jgi:hypothetical protein
MCAISAEPFSFALRNLKRMTENLTWPWVQTQVSQTMQVWIGCAGHTTHGGRRYSPKEQENKEKAYDEELRTVERDLKKAPRTRSERLDWQNRITKSFARFSATALDLEREMVDLLTTDLLPAGIKLARWGRRFDPSLSMSDITQACRNAWTACGLQPLLGEPIGISPSILGYSLLYPYSDNYLDCVEVSDEAKLHFSERFRDRLKGERLSVRDDREKALWDLVTLVEGQYPRSCYPQVWNCLLAIHRAQEESIAQSSNSGRCDDAELLRKSCTKGGSSVLADACLARGWLNEQESRFAFEWGVLLQLGDDLQDLREDMRRGSETLFSRAAALATPLDDLAIQLLSFSNHVGSRMDDLPNGDRKFKEFMKMSWRSLIVGAVADSHEFFSQEFLADAESYSPFRFEFLRTRRDRMTTRRGLYPALFDAFLETPDVGDSELPAPDRQNTFGSEANVEPVAAAIIS